MCYAPQRIGFDWGVSKTQRFSSDRQYDPAVFLRRNLTLLAGKDMAFAYALAAIVFVAIGAVARGFVTAWRKDKIARLRSENDRLREAIRRLADQDATLSVVGGNVIVEIDAALTDAEREAVGWASTADWANNPHAATLRALLDRTK